MTRRPIGWRLLVAFLQRTLPPDAAATTLGDLLEDYRAERRCVGWLRASWRTWLDARSVASAYRAGGEEPGRRPPPNLGGLRRDVVHAARACRRMPLTSALAIGTSALGIGVTTAMFSVFYQVLLQPLPYPEPDRLVVIYDTLRACPECPASIPNYFDWRARSRSFSAIGASAPTGMTLTTGGEPVRLSAARASASLADVYQVRPRLGRWFTEAEDAPGGSRVVVMSDRLWRLRFGGDDSTLGRTVVLDGNPVRVIGVMPGGFDHGGADLFVPLAVRPEHAHRDSRAVATLARLAPGIDLAGATADMRRINADLVARYGGDHGIDVRSYHETIVGSVSVHLWLLLGAVVAVLLIGCANMAHLLMASGLARRQEWDIRLALGARISHIARQLATEGLLLSGIGGAFGLGLALWMTTAMTGLAGSQLPRPAVVALDLRLVLFATALSGLVGLGSGLWPLVALRARGLAGAVRHVNREARAGGLGRLGQTLVVGEVALAFALLVTGGLLVKNLVLLERREIGLETAGVMTFGVAPSGQRYSSREAIDRFFGDLLSRLDALDVVAEVGSISHLPMQRWGYNGPLRTDGLPTEAARPVEFRWFAGRYFQALGIPVLEGRYLDESDRHTRRVLVNETMAGMFWPGERAVGRRFGQGDDRSSWWEVAGVVGNVRSAGVTEESIPEFYQPLASGGFSAQTIVLRVAGDPTSVVPAVRDIVRDLDPLLAITGVQTMEAVVGASMRREQFVSALASVFAVLAGVLAAVGTFGVTTYNVRQHRRDWGIRLALGADGRRLRNSIVAGGLRVAAAGAALGAATALASTSLLLPLLHDVTPVDPWVYATVAALLTTASIAASWLPARAAERSDPMIVFRA